MGPNPSGPAVPQTQFVRPFTNDIYVPVGASRMNDERSMIGPVTLSSKQRHRPTLLKTAFTGIWSIETSDTLGPCPRTGHFCYYDDASHTAYVGYGLDSSARPLFDLWALDALTLRWRNIPLTGATLCGRSGTRCSLIGTHLVLFGGYAEPNYFGDLHTIDVVTGEVKMVNANGTPPSERSTPIVAIYGNKFFVWGGFNGEWPNELNVLDFATMSWSQVPQEVAGRTAVPSVIIGNTMMCFGGSKNGGMLVCNLDTGAMSVKQTIGQEPPSTVMGSGMVAIGKYVFFFGGKANNDWTLMYACDTKRMWWFIFHVTPDGETVSVADGSVSDLGLFMLPRIHSFGVCYVKEKRQIVAFLGHPEKDPPPLFIVSVGEAMSVIHMRDDMIDALNFEKQRTA